MAHKSERDELCMALKISPARKTTYPNSRIQASLTRMQRRNKAEIIAALQSDETKRFSMAADNLEVWTEGQQGAMRFNLSLSRDTLQRMVEQSCDPTYTTRGRGRGRAPGRNPGNRGGGTTTRYPPPPTRPSADSGRGQSSTLGVGQRGGRAAAGGHPRGGRAPARDTGEPVVIDE